MRNKTLITVFILVAAICACNKDAIEVVFHGFDRPSNFPGPVYRFDSNPLTKDGFELGRKLFYDPVLSANNKVSCGNCHIQTAAFAHNGHSVSHGIFDRLGTRNSPAIMNLAWSSSFMWDGGIFDLDLQPIAPITNHLEMGDSVSNVLNRLRNSPDYQARFQRAYGTTGITPVNFLKALSQFMVMCVSDHSKYDSVMRHLAKFTASEQAGYLLYREKCSNCHSEPLFTNNSFKDNGLGAGLVNDFGRYNVTLVPTDKYKFKVPSLRNLGFTAPYMHDGRFFTLDAVLDHYSSKVKATPNLDPSLQKGSRMGIELTADEKEKILSFLKMLDDQVFIRDKRFSEQ